MDGGWGWEQRSAGYLVAFPWRLHPLAPRPRPAGAHSRGGDVMTSNTRARRLIDEFEEAASFDEGYSIRHGIAAVLRHLADTEADMESWYAVPTRTLEDLADALEAPTLLERAMKGDATAAKQFLHEAGFTDKQGQWLPQYQPIPEAND